MPQFFIRSTIFNLCFYVLTAISCIAMLPTLFLPHGAFLGVVKLFVHITAFLEKYILGLTYEVRGQEYLPKDGAYIVAAKHQSAYETFKLHILFDNPAIVLKKELLKIPLWGRYLAKSDVIAIDRSSPKLAIKSVKEGAQRVAAQGRPIVIFPQGTRVSPDISAKDKPYKIGIVRMQEATNLPIIPLALNTGVFYPKGAWVKKAGNVVFEFLPPIAPSDDPSEALKKIEIAVEKKSMELAEEGRETIPSPRKSSKFLVITAIILFIAYTVNWFITAGLVKKHVLGVVEQVKADPQIIDSQISEPKISGFPFKMKLSMSNISIKTNGGFVSIDYITAKSLPFMNMPIDIKINDINISIDNRPPTITIDSIDSKLTFKDDVLNVTYGNAHKGEARAEISGIIDFSSPPYPVINLNSRLINISELIENMAKDNVIKPQAAFMASAVVKSLEKDGIISNKITSQGRKLYFGYIKIFELPRIKPALGL